MREGASRANAKEDEGTGDAVSRDGQPRCAVVGGADATRRFGCGSFQRLNSRQCTVRWRWDRQALP